MSRLLEYLVENEPSFRKVRLPALYSDFRSQRTLNPDGYQANLSAWRRALAAAALSGLAPPSPGSASTDLLVLACDDSLLTALESKQYGRPLALGAVVAQATADRELLPLHDFLRAADSIYARSWRPSPWAVAAWVLRQLGLGASAAPDHLPGGRFVVLANAEAAARAFGEAAAGLATRSERTFSRAHFRDTFAGRLVPGRALSETDVDVLLTLLSRDKGAVLYDGRTVRIRAAGDGADALAPEDASVAQLRELLARLAHQTAVLGARIDELARAAREAVARGSRAPALAALRSKKLAEASLARRLASAAQLEEVAARIEQAADSVQMVRAMEAGGAALRSLNAAAGGAARVEDVVGRLREQMDQADEVNTILAEGGAAPVDEGEVDDELGRLEEEERAREEASRREREEREAEETRRRLEAIEKPGPLPEGGEKAVGAADGLLDETAEGLGTMALEGSS